MKTRGFFSAIVAACLAGGATTDHDLARAQTQQRSRRNGERNPSRRSERRCTWGPNAWKRPAHIPAP